MILEIEPGVQVLADRARVAVHQPIVEPLVVGGVEALLLERPFEIPVDLGQEKKAWRFGADRRRDPRPEGGSGDPPCLLKDLRQYEHRHVATDAIALARNAQEFAQQGVLQRGIAIVQLQRVGPTGEVRVAAVGQDAAPAAGVDTAVVLRLRRELLLRPGNEELRMFLHPAMVGRHVVGDEIEDEPQPALGQASAQTGERLVPAEVDVYVIVAHREARPANVGVPKVRQNAVIFRQPLGIRRGHVTRGLAGLPDAQEPDQVESVAGELIQLGIGDVVERRRPAERGG